MIASLRVLFTLTYSIYFDELVMQLYVLTELFHYPCLTRNILPSSQIS